MRIWRVVLLGLFFALAPFVAQGAEDISPKQLEAGTLANEGGKP